MLNSKTIPQLGYGVTYDLSLNKLIQENNNLLSVIEIEPQTFWMETRKGVKPFRVFDEIFEEIASLPLPKLVHSVGLPIGGTKKPDSTQIPFLQNVVSILKPAYLSEHLSFNETTNFHTGFFLPPCQNKKGINNAVDNIKYLQDKLNLQIAIETGVNYFKPLPHEIDDGEFVARVAEKANCAILLDLHNLYANEFNGRQSINNFINQLPLDRIWEIHVAGGFEMDGYYLDSHSGEINDIVLEATHNILPLLPNLKAIIFEIFPTFLNLKGEAVVVSEMKKLKKVWQNYNVVKKINFSKNKSIAAERKPTGDTLKPIVPQEWELAIGELSIGKKANSILASALSDDKAFRVVRKLIFEFRASMIVRVLPLSSRLIMLSTSPDILTKILEEYCKEISPKQFASTEALQFINYLKIADLGIPSLSSIIIYEEAVIESILYNKNKIVTFEFDPVPLLRALSDKRLPETESKIGEYEIEIAIENQDDDLLKSLSKNNVMSH